MNTAKRRASFALQAGSKPRLERLWSGTGPGFQNLVALPFQPCGFLEGQSWEGPSYFSLTLSRLGPQAHGYLPKLLIHFFPSHVPQGHGGCGSMRADSTSALESLGAAAGMGTVRAPSSCLPWLPMLP